jgi:hypothetical protein
MAIRTVPRPAPREHDQPQKELVRNLASLGALIAYATLGLALVAGLAIATIYVVITGLTG